jgi:hypothetical protein
MQRILALVLLAYAVVFIARRVRFSLSHKGKGCGSCGCSDKK